jgi:MtrB/PioB family decaheme-associated outer membrane protein
MKKIHSTSALAVAALVTAALALPAAAQQPGQGRPAGVEPVLGSYWPAADWPAEACEECPDESGWRREITLGLGWVSKEAPRFGDYWGLQDDGLYLIAGADLSYRGEGAGFFTLRGDNLGLDSRRITVAAGQQGSYRVFARYDELFRAGPPNTRTVFSGLGTQRLTLPDDWERAGTTGGMTQLQPNLRDVRLGTDRTTVSLGADLFRDHNWQFGTEYRRIEQEGTRIQGGSFLFSSALLPVPVDRVTDQLDASVTYAQDDWHVRAGYHGSFFVNNSHWVSWENPFSTGHERGRMALEPDNRFSQFMLSGAWRASPTVQTSARLAFGRMEQDETFLPATINPNLAVALPRSSLDGRVDTLNAAVRTSYSPTRPLTLVGELYYDERDNRTPQDEFIQVITDTAIAQARVNRPYGYEKTGGKLSADYRLTSRATVAAGGQLEQMERTYQEVDETTTTTLWGEARTTPTDLTTLRVRLTQERRRFDSYVPEVVPEENPLLRKFHLADRDRDALRVSGSYMPMDNLSLGLSVDVAKDDYMRSPVGLQDSRDVAYMLDASLVPWENASVYGFLGHERIESRMAGSQGTSAQPDWRASQRDTILTAGVGGELRSIGFREGLDVGAEYAYSYGKGRISIDARDPAPGFPTLRTRLHSINLFGRYPMSEQLFVRVDYWFEWYRSADFFVDDVEPDTVPGLLSLGHDAPNYTVHVIGASVQYRF